MTALDTPAVPAAAAKIQLKTYTVIGLVDLDAEEPELLVAGVIEDDAAVADDDQYSGAGDRYARFCHQVRAVSTEDAEVQCHAYVRYAYAEETFLNWDDADQEIYAEGVYRHLTANARAIFTVLANAPEKRFTGEQLARAAGLKNLNAVAGSLSRPRVLCTGVNRIQCWWFSDPVNGRVDYWFDEVHARLFLGAGKLS